MEPTRAIALLTASLLLCSACSTTSDRADPVATPTSATEASSPSVSPSSEPAAEGLPPGVSPRPGWLGQRELDLDERGFGIARGTPQVLRNRRLVTPDHLPPPPENRFVSSVRTVPRSVVARSTWVPRCPVTISDLRYVRASFWGFDRVAHTGELLVHRSVAHDAVSVFRALFRARWPIEEMRITSRRELHAPPTGDGNNTSAFVCRPSRLSDEWSQHAYGLAIDINPFHNPYVRDDLVLPELALAYRNRGWTRPGMIFSGGIVTQAFDTIGWGWGGDWSSSKDWMHFSRSGG